MTLFKFVNIEKKLNFNHTEFTNEPSEGEIFLTEFFLSEGISFEVEVKLPDLKEDKKSYRVADFYLTKLKVYVEFFGRWNTSDDDKNKYREKIRVYKLNNIPCIFLYPENLGIIHYSFRYRLRQVLKTYNMSKELFRFNLKLFCDERFPQLFWFTLSIFFIILFQFDRKAEYFWQSCIFFLFIAGFNFFRMYLSYRKFFLEDSSYVNFQKE